MAPAVTIHISMSTMPASSLPIVDESSQQRWRCCPDGETQLIDSPSLPEPCLSRPIALKFRHHVSLPTIERRGGYAARTRN